MAVNSVVFEGPDNSAVASSYNQASDMIYIRNGATAINFTIANGATIYVSSGGFTSNTIINNGAVEAISANGVSTEAIIYGGSQQVYSGGEANYTILNKGSQIINYGATANHTYVDSAGNMSLNGVGAQAKNTNINGGKQVVGVNAIAITTLVNNSGVQSVLLGSAINTGVNNTGKLYNIQGTISETVINNGGLLVAGGIGNGIAYNSDTLINSGGQVVIGSNMLNQILGSAIDYNARIYGSQTVLSGSIASNATIFNGGYQDIKNGGHVFATVVSSGGLLNTENGATISGTVTVEAGGSATIYNNAGGAIDLVGDSDGGVTISGLANGGELNTVLTIISGFSGQSVGNSDIITLAGIEQKDVKNVEYVDAKGDDNPDYVTLTLANDQKIILNIIGAKDAGYALGTASDGSLTYEVCFLTGTMIKIPDGEKAIEDLRIGDLVCTFDWKHNKEIVRPICWIGNQKTTVKLNDTPDFAGYPVRILKNAIADGIPYKDLLVTPEHCLFFEDKFIPARMLINDSSIYYDYSIIEYTYYHIETEEHAIIWADGTLTESYLDTGNRHSFRQHGNLVLFNRPSSPKKWDTDAGAPLMVQRSVVEDIYNQIAQRATDIGCIQDNDNLPLTNDPDLHLVTKEDYRIYPHFNSEDKYIFSIPEDVETVYLHSRSSRPCDVIGPYIDDRRNLGVLVSDIFIFTYDKIYQMKDYLLKKRLKRMGCYRT